MSDMKCPICNGGKIITYLDGTYECDNPECSIYNGTHTETFEALMRTRKALDVANEKLRHCVNITVEELDELKGNLLIAWNALLHFSKDPIANNALKKITTTKTKP